MRPDPYIKIGEILNGVECYILDEYELYAKGVANILLYEDGDALENVLKKIQKVVIIEERILEEIQAAGFNFELNYHRVRSLKRISEKLYVKFNSKKQEWRKL